MNTLGVKICKRCLKEKPENHFHTDDRGNWCMICIYEFLLAHGDESDYADAREFTHPNFRDRPRSPSWVLTKMRQGLTQLGLLGSQDHSPLGVLQPDRMGQATRLPGERALMCDVCKEKFGGETVFKAHRKYGNKPGRPSKDAVLTCYSLIGSKYNLDENNVWRGVAPNNLIVRNNP